MVEFETLPLEVKQKIFSYLPIKTLKKLKLVSSEWKTVVQSMQDQIRKIVDKKVQDDEVKSVSMKSYLLQSSNLEVETMSQDYIAVVTSKDTCIADSSVHLYNFKEDSILELNYLTEDIENNSHDHFEVALNNNLCALNFFYKDTNIRKNFSLVMLWSLKSRQLILQEQYKECYHIATDSSKKMNILLVYHTKLEVICFQEKDGEQAIFHRFSVNTNDDVRKYGVFHYPYATLFETNLTKDISRLYVWKIDGILYEIENVVSCEDKRYFAKKKDGSY